MSAIRAAAPASGRPVGFPVAASTISDILKSDDVLRQAAVAGAMLSRDELLRLVAQPAARVHPASVYKRRFHFTLGACHAEYDQLLVNGAAVESVAIESMEPQAVLELQATPRLGDFENQSYPLVLSRILGITPQPGVDGARQGSADDASPGGPAWSLRYINAGRRGICANNIYRIS